MANDTSYLIENLDPSRTPKSFAAAFYTLFLYDYVITFEREVRLFWKYGRRNLNATGVLFIPARYIPFFLLFYGLSWQNVVYPISLETVMNWLPLFGIVASEGILIARTYALWGSSRRVAILLLSLAVAFSLPYIVVLSLSNAKEECHLAVYNIDIPGVSTTYCDRLLVGSFAAVLGFETVILGMTIYGCRRYRTTSNSLVQVVYRDGAIYFACIVCVTLVNLITTAVDKPILSQADIQLVSHSVFATRIVLHIRDRPETREETSRTDDIEMTILQLDTIIT